MTVERPNILLVMVDQLAGPALPIYGHPVVQAPNIQALAERGVVFENCYCNFPICGPSRASLHTGLYPHSINCYDNAAEFSAAIPALPHYLRRLDYDTTLCGKMHFVGPDQLHGYQHRLTTEIYPANFAWTVDWREGREFRPTNLTMAPVIESGPCVRTLQMDYDDEVAYHAVQSIYDLARSRHDKPFFLTVSFTHPHSPFVIANKYWDRYRHDDIDMPAVGDIPPEERDILGENLYYCQARHLFTVTEDHIRNARRAYYGMISYIDEKLGQILKVLRETGLDRNTITIFTADHGEMMGERGMWYKQHFWEWSARVPLIIAMPDRGEPSRVKENVSLIDLMPTILEFAANLQPVDLVRPLHGHSLAGLISGDAADWPDIAISEYSADGSTGPSRMVRKGPYKYMNLEGVDQLLFNLEEDPLETNNLSADPAHSGVVTELSNLLARDWDIEEVRQRILADQKRRRFVHAVTGGDPTYVYMVRNDDDQRYIRNAGAADTKARARLPYIPPAKPDKSANRGMAS